MKTDISGFKNPYRPTIECLRGGDTFQYPRGKKIYMRLSRPSTDRRDCIHHAHIATVLNKEMCRSGVCAVVQIETGRIYFVDHDTEIFPLPLVAVTETSRQ